MTDDLDDRIRSLVHDSVRDAPTTIADPLIEPVRLESHRRGRTLVAMVAAAAVLIVVGLAVLTRGDDSGSIRPVTSSPTSDSSTPTVPTTIEYPSGSHDVIVQIGGYDLGTDAEGELRAPSLVIYGDGYVYGARADGTLALGQMDAAAIQSVLSAANDLPAAAEIGSPDGTDELAPTITVLGRTWTVVGSRFVTVVSAAFDESLIDRWDPELWFERPIGEICRVVPGPSTPTPRRVPVFPHLMEANPVGARCSTDPTRSEAPFIQIGSFDIGGSNPDGFVFIPSLVVYGDGTAYRAPYDDADLQFARLDQAAIRSLASVVKADRTFGETTAEDQAPLLIRVGDATWTVNEPTLETEAFLDQAQAAFDESYPATWTPVRWFEKPFGATCSVVDTPTADASYRAPVLPHLLSANPTGGGCSTEPGSPPVRLCSAADLTPSVGEPEEMFGVRLSTTIVIENSATDDCAIPGPLTLRFDGDDGPIVADPSGQVVGPLPDDVVPAGWRAGIEVLDEQECDTSPTGRSGGEVVATMELPDGSDLRLGTLEIRCEFSYSPLFILGR